MGSWSLGGCGAGSSAFAGPPPPAITLSHNRHANTYKFLYTKIEMQWRSALHSAHSKPKSASKEKADPKPLKNQSKMSAQKAWIDTTTTTYKVTRL